VKGDVMSMIDAEMSLQKSLRRVAERERDAAVERMRIAEDKADDYKRLAESDAKEFNRRQRAWITRIDSLHAPAMRLANSFISKTSNLVMLRCTYCERKWVRDCPQEHDGDCPVGLVVSGIKEWEDFSAAELEPAP